ncbi:MFS general substrate transporter [Mycena kentingensis (nom. inval.)]|nr:MFS general substrate transporter [Mycena kentingensis (nom. inval.)]
MISLRYLAVAPQSVSLLSSAHPTMLEKESASPKSPSLDEKGVIDTVTVNSLDGDEALHLVGTARTQQFSEEYNKKLRRKLDMLIPPLCAAVYFSQYLTKRLSSNTIRAVSWDFQSQATITISSLRLSTSAGFLFFEFPTAYISQRLRVAKYLGVNILIWGVVLCLHAATTNFAAFFILRFLLGMCESCVAPSLILIISMVCGNPSPDASVKVGMGNSSIRRTNREVLLPAYRCALNFFQATRISSFYVMNGITQIFGGFVAYGISYDSGKHIAPYKIVYLLLGLLAILVGICVLIWMPDSPVHAKFLTKEERIAVLERVRDDQGGTANHTIKKDQVIEALTDIRSWLIVLSTMMTSIPNGALSNYSNIIIKSFGYTSKQTLILSTPGGAVHAGMTLFCGWYSDKKNERQLPIIFALVPTIIGASILIGLADSGKKGVLLFGAYLIGTFGSALSTIYAYNASNTSGHSKKSTLNAMTLVSFAVGNIIGTQIFSPKDAPNYKPGKIAILILLTVQLFISVLLRFVNLYYNKKKKANLEKIKQDKGWTDDDIQRERDKYAFADLTDKQNPYFVYTA